MSLWIFDLLMRNEGSMSEGDEFNESWLSARYRVISRTATATTSGTLCVISLRLNNSTRGSITD